MIDIMDFIGKSINGMLELAATAHKEGWLYYIIGGLIILIITLMFFA